MSRVGLHWLNSYPSVLLKNSEKEFRETSYTDTRHGFDVLGAALDI